MPSREERVAKNEVVAREINEQIDRAHEEAPADRTIRVLCECGRDECDRILAITPQEYERVRADPRRFAVAHTHVIPDVEVVLWETERFAVIGKRDGRAAEVAVEEDPRD